MTQLASWCKASRHAEPEPFQDRSLCKLLKHLFERDCLKKKKVLVMLYHSQIGTRETVISNDSKSAPEGKKTDRMEQKGSE